MIQFGSRQLLAIVGFVLAISLGASERLAAQTTGGNGLSGVAIDAEGVMSRQVFRDPTGQLHRQRMAQARAALEGDVARPSDLRKVSLTRLEKAIQKQVEAGRAPTDAMQHLAGLTRIQYVFCYPETGDIVVAGPAEGWMENLAGRIVGIDSGRPTLLLEDMVVALRAFPPSGKQAGTVFCSIDPTPEGLARMQQFLLQMGGRATPRQTQFIVDGLRSSLGAQVISIGGVSPNTHFAQVMVEADYRMKLIGIGLEQPPVKMTSYVERASASSVARNALQRWYFVPNYKSVRVSADGQAMEVVGDGVKLVGENELVGADGRRQASGQVDRASHLFTESFTKNYADLAKVAPVYAQLRNLIDMLVATAYIQKYGLYGKAGWSMDWLGSEANYPVETAAAPKQVASAVNSIWKGNRLMTPIGGGVEIRPALALHSENLITDDEGRVEKAQAANDLSQLPADRWWWD
ncbi:MAG: DUF1598 domain-containing protein [Planctomycetales bacterium]|nr:DUF1598 domain-containing protein [Planctomycetales bacterium]